MNYRMTPEEREQLRIKNFKKKVLKNDRKLSDTDITTFGISRNLDTLRSGYTDRGMTCK